MSSSPKRQLPPVPNESPGNSGGSDIRPTRLQLIRTRALLSWQIERVLEAHIARARMHELRRAPGAVLANT